MKSLLFIVLTITLSSASGQSPVIEWQKSLGGSLGDGANSVQQTSDGGFIAAGHSQSNDGDVTGNHGGTDYWVVKLDEDGDLMWQKSLGGTGQDVAWSVQQATDGGYLVAGATQSNDGDVSGYSDLYDYWIVKLNSGGNLIWQKCLGGTNDDLAWSIKQTPNGEIYVSGTTNSINGDVTGLHHTGGFPLPDFWVVKMDSEGNLIWQKCLGGYDDEYSWAMGITDDDGCIAAGMSNSDDGDLTENNGSTDVWVVRLDVDGELMWQKSLGGTGSDRATSIEQTSDGGYILAGDSFSNDGDVTGNHGDYDYWVVKLDVDGELMWQKSLGGTDVDYAPSIYQATDGGYVVAGFTQSNDGDVTGNHGDGDYWVVKLDVDGDLIWQKCLGGSNFEGDNSIAQTSDGGFIVAGSSISNDGDVSGNHGGSDFWVVKLSSVVGIEEVINTTFSIYPNPVHEKFTLATDPEAIGQYYSIVDQLGKVMLEGKITSQSMVLDVSSFAKGVYFLSILGQQGGLEIVKQ